MPEWISNLADLILVALVVHNGCMIDSLRKRMKQAGEGE